MVKKCLSYFSLSLLWLPSWAYAQVAVNPASGTAASAGTVAASLNNTTTFFTGLFNIVFYIIGVMLVAASVLKYRDYRNNSSQTTLSTPVFLLLAGLIIGFFPWMLQHVGEQLSTYRV